MFCPSNHVLNVFIPLYRYGQLNLTHVINKLTFGDDFPGSFQTLNGQRGVATGGNTQFQYFLKIIPTTYVESGKRPINTNQFSVTAHRKDLGLKADRGMPGVYFLYDISPLRVTHRAARRSALQLAANVCAAAGGLFIAFRLADGFVFRLRRQDSAGFKDAK